MSDKNKTNGDSITELKEDKASESNALKNIDETQDNKNEEMLEDFRVDFDYEEFVDDSDMKIKLTKNQIINRVMAGLGVAIAAFTIFYGIVIYGMLNDGESENSAEEETDLIQEETTEQEESDFFISNNSDENISEEVRELLNNENLHSLKTGLNKVDKSVSEIISVTCKDDVTTYDNVRNIYDYMMYYYDVKSTSYVDSDTIYDYCSSMNYISEYDMEVVYRAGKLFKDKTGDSKDYACGFTVLLRNLGLEAYYIDGEMLNDYDIYSSHGYTVVMLNDEMYIFDVAQEDILSGDGGTSLKTGVETKEYTTSGTSGILKDSEVQEESTSDTGDDEQETVNKVEYRLFCKSFDELDDMYSYDGVKESINAFEEFETLAELIFSAKVTTDGGDYTSGSVTYGMNDNVTVLDNFTIDLYDNVYFKGSVSGSKENTWKLIVRVYDDEMNYITESTLYSETESSSQNEVTYTAARGGYVKLLYVVTDENGRTCTASVTVKVNEYQETTEDEADTKEYTTTGSSNTSSQGQLSPEE